jgi:hypothetical protein
VLDLTPLKELPRAARQLATQEAVLL